MKKSKEKKNPAEKKKTAFIYSGIVIGALLLGTGIGVTIKLTTSQAEVDYTGFNPSAYQDDASKLLNEFQKNPKQDFSESELVNIGLEKYRQCENSYSIGVGAAETIVNQTIRNAQIKVGNQYFEESLSRSSMVSIATRVKQDGIGNGDLLYKGKASDTEIGEYPSEATYYTSDGYKENWGKTLDEMFIYIISDASVNQENCSKEILENGNIKITLDMNVDIASYYYKIQMKSMSNLSGLPVFEYLRHTYVFTSDMTLLYSHANEKYQAKMAGIAANIHNDIKYYYHANEKINIPQLNEQINYSIEGEIDYE